MMKPDNIMMISDDLTAAAMMKADNIMMNTDDPCGDCYDET